MSTTKRMRIEPSGSFFSSPQEHKHHPIIAPQSTSLYAGIPSTSNEAEKIDDSYGGLYASLPNLPNPAPEIDNSKVISSVTSQVQFKNQDDEVMQDLHEPKKKKYAKETWFGPKKAPKAFGDI